MNESTIDPALELRFKTVVESAVRPLAATFARKRILREELLAHLHSVFDDLLADSSNATEACERTLARFGDPRELSCELQASIPRLDRLLSRIQGTPRPADMTPRGIFRWMLVFVIGFNAILIALLSVLPTLGVGRPQPAALYGLTVTAVSSFVAFYPFQLIAARLGERSLARCLAGNRQSLGLLLAASVCFPIWLTLIYWGQAGELAIPWGLLWPAYGAGFVLGPILAIVQGRRFVEDRRYIEQWAALAVEE